MIIAQVIWNPQKTIKFSGDVKKLGVLGYTFHNREGWWEGSDTSDYNCLSNNDNFLVLLQFNRKIFLVG